MPAVSLINVTKRFENVTAIDNISFKVNDGEYFMFLGPSGCGKTTTLRIIAGLEEPDEGKVFIKEKDVAAVPPEDRGIGLVFQHFEIFPFMTVYENVAYGLSIRGMADKEIDEKVYQALEVVGLTEIQEKYPNDLGAPELQRCSIARALACGSELLLLDEPLGSLDARTRENFRFTLRSIVKGRGLTAIHVTHDQEEAMAIADRIAVFRAGRILQIGSPTDLYDHPESIFVANFVGETNFLEGVLEKGGKAAAVRLRGEFPVETSECELDPGARVIVAVRRENMFVSTVKEETMNALPGRIVRTAFLGKLVRYRIELDNGDLIEVKQPSRAVEILEEGERTYVVFQAEKALVYKYPDDLREELALK